MSLNNWPSQAVFGKVDINGNVRLTPEAISAMGGNNAAQADITAISVAVEVRAMLYLPSTQAITLTRNGVNSTLTCLNTVVVPGEIVTLSSSQLMKFRPF